MGRVRFFEHFRRRSSKAFLRRRFLCCVTLPLADVTITISLENGVLQSVTSGTFGEYDSLSHTLTGTGDNITAIAFTAFGPYNADTFADNGPMYIALDSVGLSSSAK